MSSLFGTRHWRAGCRETGTSGSEGGQRKRTALKQYLAGGLPYGAFIYMSAAGSPRQAEQGKSAMFHAIAGLALVLSARVVAGMVQSALQVGG